MSQATAQANILAAEVLAVGAQVSQLSDDANALNAKIQTQANGEQKQLKGGSW